MPTKNPNDALNEVRRLAKTAKDKMKRRAKKQESRRVKVRRALKRGVEK